MPKRRKRKDEQQFVAGVDVPPAKGKIKTPPTAEAFKTENNMDLELSESLGPDIGTEVTINDPIPDTRDD
ncbi:MAG: hypothetical protein C4575_05480 [Desulforudis sp.]|nr:hypothetical protein [Clostridia bacterium]RJX20780.1 MAG: hypothetical protein C4575_05480 [Desulforudis sp.]